MITRRLATMMLVPFLLVALVTLSTQGADKIAHTKDTLDTVAMNLQNGKALLFDVREMDEWDDGHLDQAKLVPLSKLKDVKDPKSLVNESDAKKVIYCHCRAGGRALTAAEMLRKLGYDARPLKQGYDELLKGGLPKAK